MLPIAPNPQISVMQVLKNFYLILTSNVCFGTVVASDGTGVPLTYAQDNTDGCMIRVGDSTSALPQKWAAPSTDTTLQHTLNRVPIGYLVFRKNGPVDVYSGSLAWTTSTICLQTTDSAKDTHIYIF